MMGMGYPAEMQIKQRRKSSSYLGGSAPSVSRVRLGASLGGSFKEDMQNQLQSPRPTLDLIAKTLSFDDRRPNGLPTSSRRKWGRRSAICCHDSNMALGLGSIYTASYSGPKASCLSVQGAVTD